MPVNQSQTSSRSVWHVFLASVMIIIVTWCALGPLDTVKVVEANGPSEEFSAVRAINFAHELLPEERPHPVGSEENGKVRSRIINVLRRLGYQVEEDARPSCAFGFDGAVCAIAHNILAKRPTDAAGGKFALVTAHYDSVPAGPGVADDLSSVGAMLEISRLNVEHPLPAPLRLMFTDGEEPGLLGAKVASHLLPDAHQALLDINLEARGTEGPSIMFQAGEGSGDLVDTFLWQVRPIVGASYITSLYQLLPNDTDYSVFKQQGMQGLNFAFGGGVSRYHSPRDDFSHLSTASVQAQGDAVMMTLRGLTGDHTQGTSGSLPGFVDLSHVLVLHWGAAWTWQLVFVSALLVLLGSIGLLRSRSVKLTSILWNAFKLLLTLAASVGLAGGLIKTMQVITKTPTPWLAHPQWVWSAVFAGCLAIVVLSWRTRDSKSALASFSAMAIVNALALAALTAISPGLSAMLLVQSLAASLALACMGISSRAREGEIFFYLASWLVACLSLIPATRLFAMMLTPAAAPAVAIPFTLLAQAAVPILVVSLGRRPRTLAGLSGMTVAIVSLILVVTMRTESRDDPKQENVYQIQDVASGKAWIAAGDPAYPLSQSLTKAAPFSSGVLWLWPRTLLGPRYLAPIPLTDTAAPSIERCATESAATAIKSGNACLLWKGTASYDAASFSAPPKAGIQALQLGQLNFPIPEPMASRGFTVTFLGKESLAMPFQWSVSTVNTGPVDIFVSGRRYGLSGPAAQIAAARSPSQLPANDGDQMMIISRQSLDSLR